MPRNLALAMPDSVGLSRAGIDTVNAAVQAQIDAGWLAGAVTMTARRGQLADLRVMGVDDTATGKPLAHDTIFRIFSMTKPVTATAMMILHDQGLWRPEDPIAKHLPELENMRVYTGDDAQGRPVLTDAERQPTLADLMTHRAGFGYGLPVGEAPDRIEALYREAKLWEAADLKGFIARLGQLPLAYQPGTQWRYSLSMDVQGAIVERLSGQSLPDFYRMKIFEPLGMADTAFHVPPQKADRLAKLYFKMGEGAPLMQISNPLRPDLSEVPAFAHGGGGLYSTAPDYMRFAQLLLNRGEWNGKRIVSERAIAEQMTNRLPETLLTPGWIAGQQKFRPGFGYGYNGVVFYDPAKAGLPVGRGTYHWDGAASTWFWADPENDLAFVGMVQLLSYQAPPLQETTQRLMADAIVR